MCFVYNWILGSYFGTVTTIYLIHFLVTLHSLLNKEGVATLDTRLVSTIGIIQVGSTVQIAEWYRASASGSVDLGFNYESCQTNDFKIGIHSFPA